MQEGNPATQGGVGDDARPSLRADQVQQTRAALIAAGRHLFGRDGFAATSVDDLARQARLTTGAMYHHFPNKTALFEAVFEDVHAELLRASMRAAETPEARAAGPLELLARGCDAFLDAVLEPEVQRIVIIDAPAVLGLERFTELDERYALTAMVLALEAAEAEDPETIARLVMGALTRGAMLIALSDTPRQIRDRVSEGLRSLLGGISP
jgi:AcrR family transcriptional regulator